MSRCFNSRVFITKKSSSIFEISAFSLKKKTACASATRCDRYFLKISAHISSCFASGECCLSSIGQLLCRFLLVNSTHKRRQLQRSIDSTRHPRGVFSGDEQQQNKMSALSHATAAVFACLVIVNAHLQQRKRVEDFALAFARIQTIN